MPLVDQGGLFLGMEDIRLGKMVKKKKEKENHHGLEWFLSGIKLEQMCGDVFVKANHIGNHTAKSYTEWETQRERGSSTSIISNHKNN